MSVVAPGCPNPSFVDRYVGREEAAKILGVSVRTLDRLANNDPTFPRPRKIGRSPKWLLSELIAWMEDRKS